MGRQFGASYSEFFELINRPKPYQKEVDFIYKWANKPRFIFDVGCGTANYWKYYPKETNLYGIDKSPSMIKYQKNIICEDITKYKAKGRFECVTALFDVINYIEKHAWWKHLPLIEGGVFIFDIWDKKKVDRDGFSITTRTVDSVFRRIIPLDYNGKYVDLKIEVADELGFFSETHRMYVHSHKDIERFCGKQFKIEAVKSTKTWQTWYKLKRK